MHVMPVLLAPYFLGERGSKNVATAAAAAQKLASQALGALSPSPTARTSVRAAEPPGNEALSL